jgi:hypothetical protein
MANYKDNDPKGWCGDPGRGSALGRATIQESIEDGEILNIVRKELDDGGYDELGTYFGIGDPIYWVSSENGEVDYIVRAKNLKDAREQVSKDYPGVIFGGDKYDISLNDGMLNLLLEIEREYWTNNHELESCEVNNKLRNVAREYEKAIFESLENWVKENIELVEMEGNGFKNINNIIMEMSHLGGGAGYLYFMECEEAGIGTWDGRWKHLFKNQDTIILLSQIIKHNTYNLYSVLKETITNCIIDIQEEI